MFTFVDNKISWTYNPSEIVNSSLDGPPKYKNGEVMKSGSSRRTTANKKAIKLKERTDDGGKTRKSFAKGNTE